MAAGGGGFSFQDSSLLDELLNAIELDPTNIEAKKLLAEQWQVLGWEDAAVNLAEEVLAVQPGDEQALFILDSSRRRGNQQQQTSEDDAPPPYSPPLPDGPPASDVRNVQQLKNAYKSLRDEAKNLLQELLCFKKAAPSANCNEQVADLTALTEGRISSVARRTVGQPASRASAVAGPSRPTKPNAVRALASSMKVDLNTALEVAISDFTQAIDWERQNKSQRGGFVANSDAARDAVRKRAENLKTELPNKMKYMALEAFMHVEHEVLRRNYINSETMIGGDPIADIARADFWSSEDGYAWDLTELVQAIEAKGGAMRNPLSRENFTVSDVEAIVRHPHGNRLAAMQVEQHQLSKGVRQDTIRRMRELAQVVLDDQSANSHPSHDAVDSFLAYMATLPLPERDALNKLRVPAVDSHTRQKFDMTIGDAVRDAKANQICFHKAGDLLKQAADWLTRNR